MPRNRIIPYNPALRVFARKLRKEGTMGEALLWKKIRNKALGAGFHRQVPIDQYIVDFYCHELYLALEIDGQSHDEYQYQKDVERQQRLESLGIRMIRFTEHQVRREMKQVIESLEAVIEGLRNNERSVEHPP